MAIGPEYEITIWARGFIFLFFNSKLRTLALDTVILVVGFGQTCSVRGCGELGLEKTLVKNALNMLAFISGYWIFKFQKWVRWIRNRTRGKSDELGDF